MNVLLLQLVGLILRPTGCEDWLYPQVWAAMWVLNPQSGIRLKRLLCSMRSLIEYFACIANQVALCCGLKLVAGCIIFKTSWEGLSCRAILAAVLQVWGYILRTTNLSVVGSCLSWNWRNVMKAISHQHWSCGSLAKDLSLSQFWSFLLSRPKPQQLKDPLLYANLVIQGPREFSTSWQVVFSQLVQINHNKANCSMPWLADPWDMFKKYSFVHKLFNLSPELTDTKQNEQIIWETVDSDPEKKMMKWVSNG